MAKKRAKLDVDFSEQAAAAGLFDKTEPARPAAKSEKRKHGRAVYDLPPHIKTAVSKRATRLGIPASQLAAFLLNDGLQRLDAGDIDPSPYIVESESPRFRHNLDFNDWYQG
jgi:hypothetical protein